MGSEQHSFPVTQSRMNTDGTTANRFTDDGRRDPRGEGWGGIDPLIYDHQDHFAHFL